MLHYLFRISILFLLLVPCFVFCQEQEKVEYEKRVKKEEFPENSILLIEELFKDSKKARFFKEFDGSETYFEFKVTYESDRYSIKFSADGKLYDVEVVYDFKKLPDSTRHKIKEYLEEEYKRYSIKRFQLQYVKNKNSELSDKEFILQVIDGKVASAQINFEVEVEVLYEDDTSKLIEYLYDSSAKVIKRRKVKSRDEDFILY